MTVSRDELELSIVMPCLNEAETVEACIRKALKGIAELGIQAEVIIADNGSTDGSQALARALGARVVDVVDKGYGNALLGGIRAARGQYVIMGDADDSYDFSAIRPFVEKLREGFALVMGNRFRGGIRPGAMPFKHRWLGNPVLSGIGRLLFDCPAGDFHCGLRGFSKAGFEQMQLQTTGMEFASEMVISATLKGLPIAEVPTVLYKDGRSRPPHLRSWRDGWRHLRFMLLYSPRWLFLYPGLVLLTIGLTAGLFLIGGPRRVGGFVLDIHSLLVAGLLVLLGHQLVTFAIFTRIFAVVEGFLPARTRLQRLFQQVDLEKGLLVGGAVTAAGISFLVDALLAWRATGFAELDPRVTMRSVIPAVVLMALGIQTIFGSFFLSILGLARRGRP